VRRLRLTRLQLLLGLVVVLLATVPVLIPLVWTKASESPGPDPLRLAASPGVPALPRADAASATATATTAPPDGAGELAPTPSATPSPSPTIPSPTPAPSTTPPAEPTPTPDPTTPTPDPTDAPTVLVAGADLVVVSVSWSPQPTGAGQPVLFAAVVRNTGTDPTPAVTHGVAFSVDGTEVTWSANSAAPLAPGEERTYTADGGVSGNTWTATSGAHTVEALVDDMNRIPETSENDNTATAPLTVL
jgi:hypothetical protein